MRDRTLLGKVCLIFLCLSLSLSTLSAQDQENRRTMLVIRYPDSSPLTTEARAIMGESLLLKLQDGITSVDFVIPVRNSIPANGDESLMLAAAVASRADSVLVFTINGELENVSAEFRLLDALSGGILTQGAVEGSVDNSYRKLFAGFWYPAVADLQLIMEPIQSTAIVKLILRAGSAITILEADEDETPAGEIPFPENGRQPQGSGETSTDLEIVSGELAVPASYTLRITHPSAETVIRDVFISENTELDISANQQNYARFYYAAGLQNLSFLRAEAGMLFARNRIGVGLGFTAYQLGFQPLSGDDEAMLGDGLGSLLVSYPLLLVSLTASYSNDNRVSGQRRLISWYTDLSTHLRIITQTPYMIDPVFPLEVKVEPGLQWNIGETSALRIGLSAGFSIVLDQDAADYIALPDSDDGDLYISFARWLYLSGIMPTIQFRSGVR